MASSFLKISLMHCRMLLLLEGELLRCARLVYTFRTTLPFVSSDAISA